MEKGKFLDDDFKNCSDSAVSTASRSEFSRSAGHLNALPPRRLNESVRQIIDYSKIWNKEEVKNLSLPGTPVCIALADLLMTSRRLGVGRTPKQPGEQK